MKTSHLLLLSSLAIQGLALVPKTKGPDTWSLRSVISRNPEVLDRALKKGLDIQYDNYLPELPDGWPNISMFELFVQLACLLVI